MTTAVKRRPITDAVKARLGTLPATKVFLGEIDEKLDPIPGDADGRVSRYVVLYPFAGTPSDQDNLELSGGDLVYGFQVTVAAGYVTDCEWLMDAVDALIYGWAPTVTGMVCGPCRPPLGFDPGPIRADRDVKPPRFYVPLQYRTTVTT